MGFQAEGPEEEARQRCFKRGEASFQKRNEELLSNIPEGFTVVSIDESFFTYDSLVRRVWIEERRRPIVTVTGSHRHSCVFGALSLDGKQIFRQYDIFNEDTFREYLTLVHYKFPRCFIFLDKANPHYKSRKVKRYFDGHKDSLIPIWLPTASPEFMVLEECWNISKNDLLVLAYYRSFPEFRKRIGEYLRTKRFNLDMKNYLLTQVS
jgi:hypothetical protein